MPMWHSKSVVHGKLVLSGLPMEETRGQFPAALQVCCMGKSPEQKGGVTLKTAELVRFEIANPRGRQSWHDVFRKVFNTVMSGDDAVVHCMAGRHRGGTTAVMCRALLANESFDDAERHILDRREIEVSQAMRSDKKMSEWVRDVRTRTQLPRLHPLPLNYLATESRNLHMEQSEAEGVSLCQHAQAGDRVRRLRNPQRTTDKREAVGWGRPVLCWPVI